MINLTREEAQHVLDAMIPYQQKVIATTKEYGVTVSVNNEIETAIETLRARLSAPEPEPVAWMNESDMGRTDWKVWAHGKPTATIPLYTAECTPMVRTTTPEDIAKIKSKWVGLTETDEYERGVIDGMQKQMQSSVDKAVNKMAKREWQGLTEAERLDILDAELTTQTTEHFALAQAIEANLKEKNT
jgi:hypothetical protein